MTELSRLALAAGLGLLVGIQREYAATRIAGARTFTLIALAGALAALVPAPLGTALVAVGLAGLVALLAVGNWLEARSDAADPGMTTEIAALAMYLVGVVAMVGSATVAVVSGGAVAVLLQWKQPLEGLVDRLHGHDMRAIARLVLIALVILPLLPNRTYGPYDVLNPREIWLMVVLVVGISLAAYVAQEMLGRRAGTVLAGVFGGLISSTAATVSAARATRTTRPGTERAAAAVILIASTIVFVRVLVEIAVVAPGALSATAPPLAAAGGVMALVALGAVVFVPRADAPEREHEPPPTELGAAIVFGLLYAAVLFAVAAVKTRFGDTGLYVVAALSGLTDMDAITLSTAQLIQADRLDASVGWRLILVGAVSNIVFKAGAVAVLGSRRLLLRTVALFALPLAGAAAVLLFWPG